MPFTESTVVSERQRRVQSSRIHTGLTRFCGLEGYKIFHRFRQGLHCVVKDMTVKSHCLSRVVCLLEGGSKVEIA